MPIFNTFPGLDTGLQALGLALFHSLWQGIIIALLCSIVLRVMHRKMASLRFSVAYFALTLMFLFFISTFYLQYHILSSTSQEFVLDTAISGKEIPLKNTAPYQQDWRVEINAYYEECIQKLTAYAPFVVVFWLLGFIWYTVLLTMGLYQVQQIKRISYAPEEKWIKVLQHLQKKVKIQRSIVLLVSSQANAPFTVGWFKPFILLPPSIFTELSSDQLENILVHELAHIKRNDYLLNIIQSLIEMFLFFNPGYWYIASVLEKEREHACDQITIDTLHHPMAYARALTRLAEISHNTNSEIAIAAIGKQHLQQRIHNIMHNASYISARGKQASFKWYQLMVILILGVVFTVLTPNVQGNKAMNSFESQIPASDSVFTSQNLLYVIDGVVQGSDKKVLDEIEPDNIKYIDVLKNNTEFFNSIVQTYMKGTKQLYDGIIIIKTKGENSQDWSNIEDQAFDKKLIAFPNPSDDQLSVQFRLEKAAHVRIEVVDMNGQTVALLADQVYHSGSHQAQWSGAAQKPGWYVIKVIKENQVFTRKVVLE